MRSTGIMAIAYNRLKKHLGVTGGETFVYDLIQQLAQPEQWYLDRYHVDAVDLGRAFDAPGKTRPWTLPDGSPAVVPGWFQPERSNGQLIAKNKNGQEIGVMPEGGLYIDQTVWPLAGEDGLDYAGPLPEVMDQVIWAAIPAPPHDAELTEARIEEIVQTAKHLHETTDYAISFSVGCNLFEWSQFLFGMENLYLYIAGEKRRLGIFLDRLAEHHMAGLERLLPRLKGYVQVLVVGDDLGMQSGPQLSPDSYRELFLPRHKKIYEYAKKLSGAHIFMHNCGGIYQLIPDLIEAGVEILNPVQTSAKYMEPERLKKEFGKDMTFWGGGCDTQGVLVNGTAEEVREDVKRRLEVWMPGGGYVWNQVHNVLADVPPGNVDAMLEAAYEFGKY
jgi:uroporphyrinogen decarboxylase